MAELLIQSESNAEGLPENLRGRIPELDGIRGVAIAMVFVYHLYVFPAETVVRSIPAYLQAAGRLTWSGVDLFFVLSGFLIGGILLDTRDATNYFRVFYTRRFFRIVPAYLLCVGVVYVFMRLVQIGLAPRFSFLLQIPLLPWTPHLAFIQNFWMAKRNYEGILGVTWSLAIEEQFYFTLPFLIRILSPKRLLIVVGTVIGVAPILRTVLFVAWPGHSWAGFALLPCRADSLMLGVLGAIIMRDAVWRNCIGHKRVPMRILLAVLTLGLALLTKFSSSQHGLAIQSIGFTWIALFYLVVLLYAITMRRSALSGLLRCAPLRSLGTIAYGTYLYHAFVMWGIFGLFYSNWNIVRHWRDIGVTVVVVLVTLAVSSLSWRLFESPLIQLGRNARYEFQSDSEGGPKTSFGARTVADSGITS